MRNFFIGITVFFVLPLLVGCGQNISEQELGTIVEGVPEVEGADKPYEMPELGPPLPADFNPRSPHK
jgi:hypothetical protein